MARRYTMTDVTTVGSSVQTFRAAISGSTISAGKGYSDDSRMKSMFPKSPLYSTGPEGVNIPAGKVNDASIINNFRINVIDKSVGVNNYDFLGTDVAYMNAGFHPNSPDLDRDKLHKPIEGSTNDKPYYGYPNLQVSSIDPLETRDSNVNGLLRQRNDADGGFGRRYKTNDATSKVNISGQIIPDATSTLVNIGTYFSKIYGSTNSDINATSKQNLLGSSRASESNDNEASINDIGTPSTN